ncbi:dihydroxyacetone kinase family protein, partial [Actinotalea sp. JY-7885]|uniref:dihydroxyacetone kinase family protein n=1 Tax=Actinotalea sp. JY-7885 TaxID=2758576 RepID=UPI00165E4D6E
MRPLADDPATFAEDMLEGFVDLYPSYVRLVPGGVVRAAGPTPGKVAVVVGGGSGHYPAFCGLVGPGLADGAVVGNVFTSPSTADAVSVARESSGGAGVVLLTGNYAGDVMNFTLARDQLVAAGIPAEFLVVTDDVASAPQEADRRGIAGDLTVFKVASSAAEHGHDLAGVVALAERANARTRTLGVAFDGCTMPGTSEPLFRVAEGTVGLGVGIHGEPGIGEMPVMTAAELGELFVERLLQEAPPDAGTRVTALLNGLGRTKYEELFVLWRTVRRALGRAGLEVVAPEAGELVTSLDMAGCSLTLMWLDDELERHWTAPVDTPALRRGAVPTTTSASRAAAVARPAPVAAMAG